LERAIGNVFIFEVDAVMYVTLRKAEKHVLYGELVGTTECITLYTRRRTNRGRYDQLQLFFLQVNFSKSESEQQNSIKIHNTVVGLRMLAGLE